MLLLISKLKQSDHPYSHQENQPTTVALTFVAQDAWPYGYRQHERYCFPCGSSGGLPHLQTIALIPSEHYMPVCGNHDCRCPAWCYNPFYIASCCSCFQSEQLNIGKTKPRPLIHQRHTLRPQRPMLVLCSFACPITKC